MFRELEAVDGLWHRNSDPEKHKLVLDRMVKGAGCDILFVTTVVDSLVARGAIRGVVVESKAAERGVERGRVELEVLDGLWDEVKSREPTR